MRECMREQERESGGGENWWTPEGRIKECKAKLDRKRWLDWEPGSNGYEVGDFIRLLSSRTGTSPPYAI